MPEVVFDSWLLDICLAWKVFINTPFHRGARIPSFTFQEFQNTSIWNISKLNVTLFCPPWCILDVHTKSLFEKGDLVGFWT